MYTNIDILSIFYLFSRYADEFPGQIYHNVLSVLRSHSSATFGAIAARSLATYYIEAQRRRNGRTNCAPHNPGALLLRQHIFAPVRRHRKAQRVATCSSSQVHLDSAIARVLAHVRLVLNFKWSRSRSIVMYVANAICDHSTTFVRTSCSSFANSNSAAGGNKWGHSWLLGYRVLFPDLRANKFSASYTPPHNYTNI